MEHVAPSREDDEREDEVTTPRDLRKGKAKAAWLVLADGTAFSGEGFGAEVESEGEVVFNTSMTGYPELLTDPSYRRQILTLTYPEIGNYGVADGDRESERVQAAGLVVRALSPVESNWRSKQSLSSWLRGAGVPGIAGIDTRALVRHLRDEGAMMGILSNAAQIDVEGLRARAKALPGMGGCELISVVTCAKAHEWKEGLLDESGKPVPPRAPPTRHVVAIDMGLKHSMPRLLVDAGCRVTIVPASASAEEILALAPDGVLLSNGPGDPSTAHGIVAATKALLGKVPIFGICMGHQILGQALGATTYKTPFGHRGGNQPVRQSDGRVLITSQNHGFAVQRKELSGGACESHVNLSDETNEGIDASERWAFSVQYHPEAAPGPHDARVHFARFIELMDAFKKRAA